MTRVEFFPTDMVERLGAAPSFCGWVLLPADVLVVLLLVSVFVKVVALLYDHFPRPDAIVRKHSVGVFGRLVLIYPSPTDHPVEIRVPLTSMDEVFVGVRIVRSSLS